MLKKKKIKKAAKKALSIILILSVMLSLAVPVELTVMSAEVTNSSVGEPATDESIYAMLYKKDESISSQTKNLELVFQSSPEPAAGRTLVKKYGVGDGFEGGNFAGTKYYTRELYLDSGLPHVRNTKTNAVQNGQNVYCPWNSYATNIVSVDFKDEIAPTYIASWFYNFRNISEFKRLKNLKTDNCKSMSYAFYCNTSTSASNGTPAVYDLDLSHFDTSKVEDIDNFIRLNSLSSLNLSGFDLSGVEYMVNFVNYCNMLTDINLENVDVSKIKYINCFVTNCNALETLDLSYINPTSVYDLQNFIYQNTALKSVTFAPGFSPGRDYPFAEDAQEAPAGYTGLTTTSGDKTIIAGSGGARVRITSMFSGCTSLEEIDLANWDLYYELAENHNSLALVTRYFELAGMFKNCKSLVRIKNTDKLFVEENSFGGWIHRYMFDGCESLESLDLSNCKTFIGGPGIFRGCKSLKKLDLGGLGLNFYKNTWYYYTGLKFNENDSGTDVNIFEGCEELSEVTLSQYYPPNNQTIRNGYPMGYGTCVPPVERTWVKTDQPKDIENTYISHPKNNAPTQNAPYQYPKYNNGSSISWVNLPDIETCPVGTTKTTSELFCDFQPEYAGTWIAVSKITFNAKGGSPAQQAVDGARKSKLNIPPGTLTEPTRNGYSFAGWFYTDDNGDEHELELDPANENQPVAEAWNYYAKWTPIKYNIVLHSNEAADVTETISNVEYNEFVPLQGNVFTSEDPNKILAGWNTQPSGNGKDFAANESVDKLTTIDGATVDLYAMWRVPDVTITFDSGEGATEVPKRYYTLKENENVPYGPLSEPIRDGYTFLGWYTDDGRKVVLAETDSETQTAYVSESRTLYARWQKKPVVTFKLNGGKIKESADDYVKVIDFGQAIGSIPTPYYGDQTFGGWYTAQTGGSQAINLDSHIAPGDETYYAHWGWKPQFQTNGGSYTKIVDPVTNEESYNYPSYIIRDDPEYNLGELPSVTRPNYTFLGWYIGDTDEKVENNQVVDLSENGSVFKAHWERNATSKVTLDPDGGSYMAGTTAVTEEKVYTEVYTGQKIGELPTPVKEHANFRGWYNELTGEKYDYNSVITEDVTLKARWDDHTCEVTFDPTEGKMAGDTVYTIAYGKTFTYLPGANCVEVNDTTSVIKKSFDGWYTEPNGQGEKLTTSTPIQSNVKYYANWVDNRVNTDDYYSTIRWGTLSNADVTNVGDTLVFHPQDTGNVSAHLTVDFSMITNYRISEGDVRITLPKQLFLGWDDLDDRKVTQVNSLFPNFDVSSSEDDKYFILTNNAEFRSTTLEPVYTVDPMKVKGGYTDENGVYQDYYSNTFDVKIELKNPETNKFEVYQQRQLGVEFHTEVNTQVTKEQSTATLSWNSKWGPEPMDSKEYFYVIWNLKSANTNSNQPYRLNWSEDTVHDGSVVYAPDLGVWSKEYTGDSAKTIQVVTKHPLKEAMAAGAWAQVYNEAILNVEWKSGYVEQFRTTGKASAFVGETYDDGIRAITKYIPDSGTQSKHYISGGQDLLLDNSASKLDELKYNIVYKEDDNSDNPGWSGAGEMIINPRTYVFSDGVKGRNDVLLSGAKDGDTVNKSRWNAADQVQLDDGDYYFTSLDITINEFDSVMVSDDGTKKNWAKPYQNNNVLDYQNIIIYTRTMGSSEFMPLKTIYRDELEPADGENGGYRAFVELPADTVGYKIEYTSHRYITDFKIDTALKLKDTNKIYSKAAEHVGEGKHTIIKNKAQVDIKREGFEDIVCESKKYNAWLSSYELTLSESELRAAKSCLNQFTVEPEGSRPRYFETDEIASTVEFPVAITGWTYSKNQTDSVKRVKSGTFHDLLPYGFIVDKSKIIVCGRTQEQAQQRGSTTMNSQKSSANATSYSLSATDFPGKISPEYYSVRFEDNWENSGQTMMIIDINCPEDMKATGFVVYYKCKSTINNLHINGTTPKNYVAFTDTTPNQSVPELRSLKRDNIDDSTVKAFFTSVDTNQTAYNYNTTTLRPPQVYQYGADSNVHTEGADIARHQVVGLNTKYSYHISYEGSTQTQTENLVIYDVIERQIGGKDSQWYGDFQSVDVSKIKEQHSHNKSDEDTCEPVIYYLSSDTIAKKDITKEMFDLDYEINNQKIWTTTKPDNSKVVAIAVDCRKTSNGGDFVLGIRQGLDFKINMISPEQAPQTDLETYNEADIIGFNSEIGKPINQHARTSVTLRFRKPEFVKSAYPAGGDTPETAETVVKNSVLSYVMTITNPDPDIPLYDVVMTDEFPLGLVPNNNYTVKFDGGNSIPIDNTARVGYTLETKKNDLGADVSRLFTATVDVLDPGETVEITIPVKVTLEIETQIVNEAKIISVDGVPFTDISSNKIYHVVSGVKAKLLKVNSKDEPLAGATLEIYDNNTRNFDSEGNLREGAVPLSLTENYTDYFTSFTSTDEVLRYDILPGNYVLHEVAAPESINEYKTAKDIPFTVDVEGIIRVNGKQVTYVKMVDEPSYKIVFHENKPEGTDAEKQKAFKIIEPSDLSEEKVNSFGEYPDCAGDDYVFAGWYYDESFSELADPDSLAVGKADFSESYPARDGDYHLYAKWIKYRVIFHENKPEGTDAQKQNPFKIVNPSELVDDKVVSFDEYPEFPGSEYEFCGWYHNSDYSQSSEPNSSATIVSSFDDTYAVPETDTDYHLYAMWKKKDLKIIFHENAPGATDEQKQNVVNTVDYSDLNEQRRITPFANPTCPTEGYVFDGWYHNSDYTVTASPDSIADSRSSFDDTYSPRETDYHLYAKWKEKSSGSHDYKIIFHENRPNGTDEQKQKIFKTFELTELSDGKISHFYDIPAWAGDEYVFAGWYHNSDYTESNDPDSSANAAAIFENDTYEDPDRDFDYHLYAKWIAVGTVSKDGSDTNITGSYRGFGLAGVQIRIPNMTDSNFNNNITPPGLRFVTSLSESLYKSIDALSDIDVDDSNVPVEYGYVVGTKSNIEAFTGHYGLTAEELSQYKLQYKGANVNGVDTRVSGSPATDYRYISNVNCTSRLGKKQGSNYANVNNGVVKEDHRNFGDYRLYTLVVTYEGASAEKKDSKIDARAYIRYYDANRKLRVFYNNYVNNYYGGCMCSYNQVSSMATNPEVLPPLTPNGTNP